MKGLEGVKRKVVRKRRGLASGKGRHRPGRAAPSLGDGDNVPLPQPSSLPDGMHQGQRKRIRPPVWNLY